MSDLRLPGSSRYLAAADARETETHVKTPAEKLIDRANAVSIFDVLRDFFNMVLPREGESFKSRCPFAVEHDDGGLDKGWRTYPASNSSMCFPMHGPMGPVRLVSLLHRERSPRAAERILNEYGLLRPRRYAERFVEVAIEAEQAQANQIGNPQFAVEALTTYLRADPHYVRRQFDDDVLAAMEAALEDLDRTVVSGDPTGLRQWFEQAKVKMTSVIGEKK